MKIKGQKVCAPSIETIVIPRKTGDLIFKAQAVLDYSAFEALCPIPRAPETLKPGGIRTKNLEAPDFLKALDDWAEKRTAWMILKSLEATPDLEWETIQMDKPETWKNFDTEFKNSGLSALEINKVLELVTTVCGLDQKKIEEATERFLAGQVAAQK